MRNRCFIRGRSLLRPLLQTWAPKAAIFTVAAAFSGVFFIEWCDLIYNCGCRLAWFGGAAQCNIQQAGDPDCPWCASPTYGGIAWFSTMGVQGAIALWPGSAGFGRLALALAASPAAALAVGIPIGLIAGYWP